MSIGALTISLALDAQDFVSGMTKSEQQAKKFADTLDRNIASGIIKAQAAIFALGAGARVAADTFKTLTTGAAEFKDLEESTGATAESIASLSISAATAGVQINDVAAAANKLTKNLVGVDDESKAAGAALKAIGLSVKEFKQLDPVGQYEAVGKALGGFADGAGKVAVAQALFGKNGAEQLRVFKALDEAGGHQVILTQQQIELADDYADRQTKSAETLKLYAQAAATQAIPALTDLTTAATEFIKELIGVDKATGKLAENNGIKEFAEGAVDALVLVVDNVTAVSRAFEAAGKTFAAFGAVFQADDLDHAREVVKGLFSDLKELDDREFLSDKLARQRAKSAVEAATGGAESTAGKKGGKKDDDRPALHFDGAAAKVAASLKKQLDGQIRAIRDFAQDQRDAYDFANKYVKGAYDDGSVSLQEYFDTEQRIRDAGLASQLEALDKEKAALQAALPKSKNADRIDIENKIAEAVAKRAELEAKAGRENYLSKQQEDQATLQLKNRYDDLLASVKQLSGDDAGAAAIRIAQQVAEAKKLSKQAGGDPSKVADYARLLTQTEELNQVQRDYNKLLDQTGNAEALILAQAQESGQSEYETMKAVGAERQKALDQMAAMVGKANELAALLGTDEANQYADKLMLAFRKATAEVDPLLKKIKDVGDEMGKSIASSFEDAIVEGKGLRETLSGIEKDLVRIVTRNLVTKPLGDYLSGVIGGNGQSSGGGGLIGSLFSSGSSSTGASAASSAGSGDSWLSTAGSWIASLFGGGKAIGGPTMPNTLYQVGERKPEIYDDGSRQWLLTGSGRGRINPNPTSSQGRTQIVNQSFAFSGPVDRRTQTQMAATAARALATANARNN